VCGDPINGFLNIYPSKVLFFIILITTTMYKTLSENGKAPVERNKAEYMSES
jgi:hypothetical protein